ncbi:glucan biosynthesis protein [Klebsiella pneumoniae]
MSARGLAIDTALPSGEEFPRFREFWIERPKANRQTSDYLCAAGLPAGNRRLSLRDHARDVTRWLTCSLKFTCAIKWANWAWRR